jgi:uncharacterized protein (DUF2267 family)
LKIDNYSEISDYLSNAIDRDISAEPTLILRSLFTVLHRNITEGELEHIQSMLPSEMRAFWPNMVTSS